MTIALVMGCSKTVTLVSNDPPNAVGEADGQMIEFIKGSYQWNNAIADAPSPDNLVKNTTVYVVKPNTELTLNFKGDKPENVRVGLWDKQNNVELPAKGDAFVLPSEPGTYVLTVWGKWSGDDHGSYAASIEIQE
ncbi:MAG TPA: hypothetical protein IAA29_17310 [Candidatus Paenibacillus intestinavium]|nr:hypothetical protein [Candidatus Paenibacillus intestinavium]